MEMIYNYNDSEKDDKDENFWMQVILPHAYFAQSQFTQDGEIGQS